jgi:hypothetical protein
MNSSRCRRDRDSGGAYRGFASAAMAERGEVENGVSTLTLTHELEGAPKTAAMVAGAPGTGGGWSFVLSDLKTLLETGSSVGI